MKVAVITVRSPGGADGGAERFYDALVQAFADEGHCTTEIPVDVDESNFDQIKLSYLKCYELDVADYDMVLSTKAPTWMVRHPNHVCYLVHTIRVFYDMFEQSFPDASAELRADRSLVRDLDSGALSPPACRKIFTIGHEVSSRLEQFNGLSSEYLHPPLWGHEFRNCDACD